jgi:glutamate-ammonia-ligase adenylyltransferase
MQVPQLVRYLDDPQEAAGWLRSLGVADVARAHANLVSIANSRMTLDLVGEICGQLEKVLPRASDPEMALNNLDRFIGLARSPLSLGALFERDPDALPDLVQIFSTSQFLSDLLSSDSEAYDLLRITEGQPVAREVLVSEFLSDVAALDDERSVMNLLRRYKRRELLRIAYGDIIRGQRVEVVTRQISFLADALCEAAVLAARRKLQKSRGVPRRPDGEPARFVVLGLGKLGGQELNYSSDIDLVFLYEAEGNADGDKRITNHEYFDLVARDAVRYLNEMTDQGIVYRVDLRLRPEGSRGAISVSRESALHYYDVLGRTWERQAFVKARPIAGDLALGREFLETLQPWIYRRYLSRADITGIKALKRRIERRARREEAETRNVKTGRGGIRDIEFVIQFLQLLNGGDLPEIRTGNTLEAIAALERSGCLTMQERTILEQNYAFLRKIEHRLQIMFDLQTHTLPERDDELRKVAIRAGYDARPDRAALASFKADYREKTALNRKILDHLLHDAFSDEAATEPEVDLVLDPDPPDELVGEVLGKYGFADTAGAYRNLVALSTETIPFLSTRRCRHFLASIAPRLLAAIAATPDPDYTLVNLSQVSDSLGGKGVLWELFSFNPPSLHLYVRLCASSPYLSGILTSHPGMIDELMDSLVLDKLPTAETLEETLAELCRGAEDVEPILHSFKNSNHLRVGVRDILGKEDVQATHRALADIAEVCLRQIATREQSRLVEKYGEPMVAEEGETARRAGGPRRCEPIILALGKLGGQEPNYHSDLDIVFLYEEDGVTRHRQRVRPDADTTTNQHFFSQLGQRIIKVVSDLGPHGRLYEMDPRLRPTGKSGALAVSLPEFARYFASGQGQLWERQALCKARVIYGSPEAARRALEVVRQAIVDPPWQTSGAQEIRDMRRRLEETASRRNLKRGSGGTVDIEFAVQMLQLAHAAARPEVLVPNTLSAIAALEEAGFLAKDDADFLGESYRFLRSIEARLRLMNTTARHDLPEDESELGRLAYLLNCASPERLTADCRRYIAENRRRFERLFDTAARQAAAR